MPSSGGWGKDDDSLPELLCSLGKFMAPTGVEAARGPVWSGGGGSRGGDSCLGF